jgi:GNAT superfamily N-acetyltransferase
MNEVVQDSDVPMNVLENARIREATTLDIPHLVALNHAAYPDLIVDGAVFDPEQIEAHVTRFPRGQLVAEVDGRLVGAISTFIPSPAIPVLKQHTWLGITDGGMFVRHDPAGRSLYLADIYVDPGAQGRGLGQLLYGALKDLCRSLDLEHVVAGGRLWGYGAVADRMTAEEYVHRVTHGLLKDPVLTSQLRAGFVVRGVLHDYLHDWRSKNYATLLEWVNTARTTRAVPVASNVRRSSDDDAALT